MAVKTVPRIKVAKPRAPDVMTDLLENAGTQTTAAKQKKPVSGPARVAIRIHKDGLLIAKCLATGVAPSRLFVTIDPLHYPINSRLEIEFINSGSPFSAMTRLPATVISRTINGIELKLDPGLD